MTPRPIRRRIVVKRGIFNIPEDGYVTPRLKKPEHTTEAIGFTHFYAGDDQDYYGAAAIKAHLHDMLRK